MSKYYNCEVICEFCGEKIDLEYDTYHNASYIVDKKTYYWHNDVIDPLKNCWRNHLQKIPETFCEITF